MAPIADVDETLKYVMIVLKHTELPKPNYPAVAAEAGINTPANAQRRFKSLIERAGFLLVNDKIVSPDGTGGTPKKLRGKKAATPTSNKKRKVDKAAINDSEGDGDVFYEEGQSEVTQEGGGQI